MFELYGKIYHNSLTVNEAYWVEVCKNILSDPELHWRKSQLDSKEEAVKMAVNYLKAVTDGGFDGSSPETEKR